MGVLFDHLPDSSMRALRLDTSEVADGFVYRNLVFRGDVASGKLLLNLIEPRVLLYLLYSVPVVDIPDQNLLY